MKYTNPQLREICRGQGIHNDHNFAKGEAYIHYASGITGRASHSPYWAVYKHGFVLSAHWANYGEYRLSVDCKADKEPKLLDAKTFALEKFGIKDWARGPFGAYYAKDFVEKRLAEIIAKHEANTVAKEP